MSALRWRSAILLVSILSGCGGGGGSGDDSSAEVSASVNAGADLQVVEKSEVTITAQASPAEGSFSWQIISGPNVEGFPITESQAVFTAPDVKADVELVIQVSYTAPNGSSASDQVTVAIQSQNQLPTPIVTQIAPDGTVKYKDTITLSAQDSLDPDENGFITSYQWQLLQGPERVQADNLNRETLSFTHPLLDIPQAAVWQLTVIDDEGGSASTQFSVGLVANPEVIIADAGEDKQVQEFDAVTLDGSKSDTVSGQKQCIWSQLTSGEQVELQNANSCITSFTAPDQNRQSELQFQLQVTDSQNRTANDNITVAINAKPLGKINDTGQTQCYNNSQAITCSDSSFAAQDAQRGRDFYAAVVAKEGDGEAGFDFTKLNRFADELPDDASDFACVRDNVTGLIWEVKEASAGMLPNTSQRNAQNSYTWSLRASDSDIQGSYEAPANTICPQDSHCGIQALIDEVNNPAPGEQSYCGGNNWRLPTYTELLSIIDYGADGNVLLDQQLFPHLPSESVLGHLYYWTAQSSIDGLSGTQRRAFVFDMMTGNDFAIEKSSAAFVRLVRNP